MNTKIVFSYLEKLNAFTFIAIVAFIINRIRVRTDLLPNPNPPIVAMEAQLQELLDATEAAMYGDRNLIKIRDEKREVVFAQVVQQAGTVVSAGLTPTQAETLGFRTAKGKSPSQPVEAPTEVNGKATGINHGAEITWRIPKNAKSFVVEVCFGNPNDPTAWSAREICVQEI